MSSEEIGELLDDLQKRVDRCKVMFEQYFLGIQKTPPHQLQVELERRIRKLTQSHISNTGLRFRFTTLSQKFTSYNTYWKRTMRQIENGSYIRDIAKLGRDAVRLGKDVPDEILAKMPKRMRERIVRDRAIAVKQAEKQEGRERELRESGKVRNQQRGNVHSLDGEDLDSLDLDSLFDRIQTPVPPPDAGGNSRTTTRADTDVDQLFDESRNQGQPPSPQTSPPPVRPRPSPRKASPIPRASRPAKPSAPPKGSSSAPPPGMSVKEAQTLYKSYKKARELVGQDTSKLNYDRLMRSLNKQAPTILKKYNAKAVKFDVVVQGDQVILKANPKK